MQLTHQFFRQCLIRAGTLTAVFIFCVVLNGMTLLPQTHLYLDEALKPSHPTL